MSEEQLKAFLEKVKADTNLQEKLKAAKSPQDVVGIAKEHGHEFTTETVELLSPEELESVAGGQHCPCCLFSASGRLTAACLGGTSC